MKLSALFILIFACMTVNASEGTETIKFLFASQEYQLLESDLNVGVKGNHLSSISVVGQERSGCEAKEFLDLRFYDFDKGEQSFRATVFRDACGDWSRLKVEIVKK